MLNNSKYSKMRPLNANGVRSPRGRLWGRLHYNVGLIILAGVSALLIMFGRESSEGSAGLIYDFKRMISSPTGDELQPSWNYSSYSFKPNVSDWDEQRLTWMTEHLNLRTRAGGKPRVMMVSGSFPNECNPSIFSHLFLRASKNKVDYCRMHDIEFFYNLGEPDQDFSDWWVKLPVIRMLMLQHPQVEWIWWLDADAVITDLVFEPPYAELEHDNLVLYGEESHVYDRKTWTGLSTANFMIRNCQWSLDLLDEWASMGTASFREESGNFQSEVLADRPLGFPGDDQSSLVALLVQDKRHRIGKQRWVPMVKLVKETEYYMNANWTVVGPKLEELSLSDNEQSVPFVTHFAGCLPSCNVEPVRSDQALDGCVEQLGRAFDFADNQVYKEFGFLPRKLGHQSEPYEKKMTQAIEMEFTANGEQVFRMRPWYSDWDERRLAWMQQYPPTRRDEVVLVSGSAPATCPEKAGSYLLLRGLKNLIDYSRKNDMLLFYNNAAIDKNLTGWWSKLPLLKMLMIDNPGTEWIWWLDSDAVITDLDYKLDFARFNSSGYNVVMYGSEHEVYDRRSYIGINTGNFLIRNCQWSLDLLDRWASYGATLELRVKNEDLINSLLSDRPPGWDADDQSVLAYVLIKEREKWGPKVCLEDTIVMSGAWDHWIVRFRDELPADERPFVTHFAGCKPCHKPTGPLCLTGQDMTYNFADNQVLQQYGLRHVHLNSTKLLKRSSIVIKPQAVGEDDTKDVELKEVIEKVSEGDTAEEQKTDKSDEEVDPSKQKKVDTSGKDEIEVSEKEKAETSKEQKTDKSDEEEVDASKQKKVDTSGKEEIEVSEEKKAKTSKEQKTDKSDAEEVDPSKQRKVDTSGKEEIEVSEEKKAKTSKEQKTDKSDAEEVDPSKQRKVDTSGKEEIEVSEEKKAKTSKEQKTDKSDAEEVDPSKQKKVDTSGKEEIEVSEEEKAETSEEEMVEISEGKNVHNATEAKVGASNEQKVKTPKEKESADSKEALPKFKVANYKKTEHERNE